MTLAHIQNLVVQGKLRGYKIAGKEPVTEVKASKYGNVKTVIDGIKFDSAKEGNRYLQLKMLEQTGAISELRTQVKYVLIDDERLKYRLCYIADFAYVENGVTIVEDVKPYSRAKGEFYLTPLFKRKAKLMERKYGITIKKV